ncbi:MAG: hypothetical protein HYV34_04700 [Candidatus Kerfeldbacteria bacterium]|nr:hypothetical protein [Candidatus Kerfeldbacteria bacterium]
MKKRRVTYGALGALFLSLAMARTSFALSLTSWFDGVVDSVPPPPWDIVRSFAESVLRIENEGTGNAIEAQADQSGSAIHAVNTGTGDAITADGPSTFNGTVDVVSGEPDTTINLANTGAGGRRWSIYSSGEGSFAGDGKFVIEDETAGGQGRLFIDSLGKVGINVVTPQDTLHVGGGITADTGISACGGGACSHLRYPGNTYNYLRGKTYLGNDNGIWNENGDVGIGTTNPAEALNVVGDIRTGTNDGREGSLYLGNPSHGIRRRGNDVDVYTDGSGSVKVLTASGEKMRITEGGAVGIGTTTPATNSKLDVQGRIQGHDDGTATGVYGETWSLGYSWSSSHGIYGYAPASGDSVGGAALGVIGRTNSWQAPSGDNAVPAGVFGWADASQGMNAGVWADNDSSQGTGLYAANNGTSRGATAGTFRENGAKTWAKVAHSSTDGTNYGIVTNGQLGSVVGMIGDGESSRVAFAQLGTRATIEEIGTAKLERGRATIRLPQDFLNTITRPTSDRPLTVFIQPYGQAQLLYVETAETEFTVIESNGGQSTIPFAYRILGTAKDIGDKRFGSVEQFHSSLSAGQYMKQIEQ